MSKLQMDRAPEFSACYFPWHRKLYPAKHSQDMKTARMKSLVYCSVLFICLTGPGKKEAIKHILHLNYADLTAIKEFLAASEYYKD
jgi:transcriptional regulatory protein LevR